MRKAELVDAIASKSGMTKKDSEAFVNGFVEIVSESLVKGEKVQIPGFGTFEVSERAERQGRNPATGEAMTITASKSPRFKAGKTLKDAVN